MKYLLSTGESTELIEKYILDQISLNMKIYKGDIPNSSIGFNSLITDIKKDDLRGTVESRVKSLIADLDDRLASLNLELVIEEISLVEDSRVMVVLSLGNYSRAISVNLSQKGI